MRVNSAKELSVYLQDKRVSNNLSQTTVADLASMRQATVSAFESKPDSAKLETLFKLLSALDLELEVRPKGSAFDQNTSSKLDW
ncbi:helix-turn-helix domain-containing protein [Hydrogenovibrio marinus]|uniref:Transcriptional regulator n=1 Tax=Hydrogenovibrio marinus TaxID=28885 RepID=A0A066ZZC0_HYDMR|nr:helix-turn-helix domain-containing protein [Hydrogenovibrio marinus]KDN95470.1 transcriptional regulator [Hydrogenovibrio marinus]BBN59962.1 transcriptional regulator [Hydrogenovibrio marinus]